MPATLEERLGSHIRRSKANVFMRREFDRFGGYDQVGRAMRALIRSGILVKAGHGIYVKARKSTVTGNPVPVVSLEEIGIQVLAKLGIEAEMGTAANAYMRGQTTQMPMAPTLKAKGARISRKIGFGHKTLTLESA